MVMWWRPITFAVVPGAKSLPSIDNGQNAGRPGASSTSGTLVHSIAPSRTNAAPIRKSPGASLAFTCVLARPPLALAFVLAVWQGARLHAAARAFAGGSGWGTLCDASGRAVFAVLLPTDQDAIPRQGSSRAYEREIRR